MPTQNTRQNASAATPVEALLREKDARIAELMADKAHLYQLLAETQASLAREQALHSPPAAPLPAVTPSLLPPAVEARLAAASEPAESPGGAAAFKFGADDMRGAAETPFKSELPARAAGETRPSAESAVDPTEAIAGMELFQFVSVEREAAASLSKAPAPMPPVPLLEAATEPSAQRHTTRSEENCEEKQEPPWRRWLGKNKTPD